jgi:hypothetical protein
MVLIIVMSASLVIDSAVGFSAKRALVEAASGAANDAANGLRSDPLYDGGRVRLDGGLVDRLARASLQKRTDGIKNIRLIAAYPINRDGEQFVVVIVTGTAEPVFGFFGNQSAGGDLQVKVTSVVKETN